MSGVTVGAIVLSYQRPRWFREALETVRRNAPDQVVVVDDGSTFPVEAVTREYFPDARFVIAPPMTLAERLVTPRLGSLINEAYGLLTTDALSILCDDDLWADGWLDAVREHFAADPVHHMVRGNWLEWRDGEPLESATLCQMPGFWMTTGNFAHRLCCYRDEGLRWDETTVSCHDASFLHNFHRAGPHWTHNAFTTPYLENLAGYRRLHKHNALNYVWGVAGYAANAADLFKDTWLESER